MRIWIDCTAAAHPLVFAPLIERFESRGCELLVTSREYGQTLGILQRLEIPYRSVGEHGGAGRTGKARALASRSVRLARLARAWRPDLALGHGSVDLALVSTGLRIPSVQMQDYEYAGLQRRIAFGVARRVLAPEAIPPERMAAVGAGPEKLVRYPGLKEDYYLAGMRPDPGVLEELKLDRERIIVVLRPPPETSEYHAPNAVSDAALVQLAATEGVQTVVIPRTERQAAAAQELAAAGMKRAPSSVGSGPQDVAGEAAAEPDGPAREELAATGMRGARSDSGWSSQDAADKAAPEPGDGPAPRVVVPDRAIDAQSLIAYSDLVVSAGGTMNREAVALGVPVYTTFAGRIGGVDEALIADGRLRVLERAEDLELRKRTASPGPVSPRDPDTLVDAILSTA